MGQGIRYPNVEQVLKELAPGRKALEIGCGAAVYGDIFEDYIGSDIMSTAYGDPGEVNVYTDACALGVKNASVDLVFSVACFNLIPDVGKAIEECFRVLKPGGVVAIFDYNRKTTKWLRPRLKEQGYRIDCHIWGPEDLEARVKGGGFSTRVVWDSHFWQPSGNALKDWIKSLKPFQYACHRLAQRKKGWSIVLGTKG